MYDEDRRSVNDDVCMDGIYNNNEDIDALTHLKANLFMKIAWKKPIFHTKIARYSNLLTLYLHTIKNSASK